jgi:hypothetical protein
MLGQRHRRDFNVIFLRQNQSILPHLLAEFMIGAEQAKLVQPLWEKEYLG